MNPNILPSNRAVLVETIDPDANGAATYTTGWISMALFENILAVIAVGDIAATGTVDAKLEQATDSSGTGVKDVTGKAITQLTQAGGDSNKQALINCGAQDLDIANDFDHVRLSITVATAAADSSAHVFGFDARQQPETDATSVAEVV